MRVRAKRLGWDEPKDGVVTKYDELEPYEYPDDWIEGELEERKIPASSFTRAFTLTLVGGQEADPKTIQEVGEGKALPLPSRVTITEADVAAGAVLWDETMPEEFRGLLDARVVE